MAARKYSNIAVSTTLSAGINNVATSFNVASATGWPAAPFTAVLDPGTASEEIILVATKAGTTFSNVTRGYDGSSGKSHSAGAEVKHCAVATDFTELFSHDHTGDYAQLDHGDLSGLADDDHSQYFKVANHTKATHDALSVDHGSLTGLADDDHSQYYNAARHTKAVHDALAIDHGSLTGLADDDHSQYYNAARHTKAVHDALNIDADTLDGMDSTDFAEALHYHTFDNIQDISLSGLQVYQALVCRDSAISPRFENEFISAQYHISDWAIGTYVPALTASTDNPTLSDDLSHVAEGWYRKIGKIVEGELFIRFGTSGVDAGSGTYRVSIPYTSKAYGRSVPLGAGYLYDDSATYRPHVIAIYGATTYLTLAVNPGAGATGTVTHSAPFAWANSDVITIRFAYEAASYASY
jgi:hypothetical protein